ncbi:MAG: tetratricopeptide repeat protein [Candidatus Didemnitutus sp.]|nr:tetratricopeptide repeat protein [Candidatus Didemnitutus sp.]
MFALSSISSWLADRRVAAFILVIAGFAAYANSWHGPFVFDDQGSIPGNPTIRSLASAWIPPADAGITVAGRPLLNFSFALNYALSGEAVWSYHAVNLLIHLGAALLLAGLVRRTLQLPGAIPTGRDSAGSIALFAALLWLVHPVQTAAVTYVVQRAESLAALWILATLHAFLRSLDSSNPLRWRCLAVAAAMAGVATKEVAAVAPLLVLLYDRTFVAGTFFPALRQRRGLYLALASSWLLLAGLMATTGARGGSVGFATAVPWWNYALQQAVAVVHYVRLAVWPHPLVFDYGTPTITSALTVWPHLLAIACALVGTIVALRFRPRAGFLAAAFFLLLAPSSSVIPVATQTMAEHRVYLPLAALTIGFALLLHRFAGRFAAVILATVAVVLGCLTWQRNLAYQDEVALWRATVAAAPENPRAHHNLGFTLTTRGDLEAAIPAYRRALALAPDYSDALNNLGNALLRRGQIDEALPLLRRATIVAPGDPDSWNSLGHAELVIGETSAAIQSFRRAIQLAPNYALAHSNLGQALALSGDVTAALSSLETAVELAPADAIFRNNLANRLAALGRTDEAAAHYQIVLAAAPDHVLTLFNSGNLFLNTSRFQLAIDHYVRALAVEHEYAEAHVNLAAAFQQLGRIPEAVAHYETALRLRPGDPIATENLRRLRREPGAPH